MLRFGGGGGGVCLLFLFHSCDEHRGKTELVCLFFRQEVLRRAKTKEGRFMPSKYFSSD